MDKSSLLEYLSRISNNNLVLNIGIHLLIIASIVAIYLLKNVKIKKYVFNSLILALFLSVTINAIIYGNPFHAITFGIMTLMAVYELIKGENHVDIPQNDIRTIIAFIFIFLGFWYPEFAKTNILGDLILSPAGIVPCPTLLTALGLLSLYYPKVNKQQFIVTVFFGIVYGLIGTFVLGVYLDISLIGVVILAVFNMINYRTAKVKKH